MHCRIASERPDMTDIWDLKPEEAPAALKLMAFENSQMSWVDFVRQSSNEFKVRLQRMSPWQGNSFAKTDEKPNSWMRDTGFEPNSWAGLFVPKATPASIVKILSDTINQLLRQPELIAKYSDLGYEMGSKTQAQFAAEVLADRDMWSALVKKAGIKAD